MGIWVVVMEAVAGDDPNTIEPEDLDALAEELGECYPQVSGGPAFYQAELWVEESNAGGAVMHALRVWQAAVRELGMPTWDVVRAEARDAYAIEAGLIEWNPPDEGELDEEDEDTDVEIPEDEADLDIDTQDYELDADELEMDDDDEELAIPPVPAPTPGRAATKRAARLAPAGRPAAKKTTSGARAGTKRAAKAAEVGKGAKGAKKARTTAAPRPKKAAPKLAPVDARTRAKKAGGRIAKRR